MSRLQQQLKQIVKKSKVMKEGIGENEDHDLVEIDRALDEVIDESVSNLLDQIVGGE